VVIIDKIQKHSLHKFDFGVRRNGPRSIFVTIVDRSEKFLGLTLGSGRQESPELVWKLQEKGQQLFLVKIAAKELILQRKGKILGKSKF
jgi:hypothetical protein